MDRRGILTGMRRRALDLALVLLLVCLSGCTGGTGRPEPAPAPSASVTTLAQYDTHRVRVVRAPFCPRVSPTGLERALGSPPAKSSRWDNGDRVRLPDGTRDRVHEYGCSWTGGDRVHARAWVFAPPVTRGRAKTLSQEPVGQGCTKQQRADFGRAAVEVTCTRDGVTEISYRGLFGDAWLSCSLAADTDPAELAERASAWCVAVLKASRT